MTPEEHLAVPYVLAVESVEGPDGEWLRRAEYPELPGCVAEAPTPLEAIDLVEEARVRYILERLERGEPVPVPRPPLRSVSLFPAVDRRGFTRWLIEHRRISDDR